MVSIAFLGELIRFISVSNRRKKTFESDEGNVLEEFETFIFDENFLKACDSTVSMCSETHLCSFES